MSSIDPSSLNADSDTPLYRQLYEILREKILAGEYAPGDQLPSQRVLQSACGISRHTVQEALSLIIEDGLVHTHPGRGVFVAPFRVDHRLRLTGFSEEMRSHGIVHANRVLRAETVEAGVDLTRRLHLDEGSRVHLLKRLRIIQSLPVGIETAYLPMCYFPDLFEHDFSESSLYTVLEKELQTQLKRAEQSLGARLATSRECELLDLSDPAAVLRLDRVTYDAQARRVEYAQGIYNPLRYNLVVTLNRV
jgi:GntR family transcriptional regulator